MLGLQMVKGNKMTQDLPVDYVMAARDYSCLETKVKIFISKACLSYCSRCGTLCCKRSICSESIDSHWLRIVWSLRGHEMGQYDGIMGWLSSYGCNLTAGRPPVCYMFFCNRIVEEIPTATYLCRLKAISELVTFAGKNAVGNRHLVTLSAEDIMTNLDFNRLRNRIAKCLQLYRSGCKTHV